MKRRPSKRSLFDAGSKAAEVFKDEGRSLSTMSALHVNELPDCILIEASISGRSDAWLPAPQPPGAPPAPPPSSPRIDSPGRSSASRFRINSSVSVSAMVTGSVGLLFERSAGSSDPAGRPKISDRRWRTNAAASAATSSAMARSSSAPLSITLLSHHNRPSMSASPTSV